MLILPLAPARSHGLGGDTVVMVGQLIASFGRQGKDEDADT